MGGNEAGAQANSMGGNEAGAKLALCCYAKGNRIAVCFCLYAKSNRIAVVFCHYALLARRGISGGCCFVVMRCWRKTVIALLCVFAFTRRGISRSCC